MHKLWLSVWIATLAVGLTTASGQNQNSQPQGSTNPQTGQSAQPPQSLTLAQAKAIALKNHPQVLAAQLTALASYQVVREVRSAYFPILAGDVAGAAASPNIRIGAGLFTNPRILSRFAQGIIVSQLITDSGRTPNLVQSSRLQARAEDQNTQATRYDVLLRVVEAYFGSLRAQALVKVAQETVTERQVVVDQVTALAQSKLKSQLDVSFANVNLAEAKLLLLGAQDNLDKSFAEFSRALGLQQEQRYTLVEEPLPPPTPPDANPLVQQAMNQRPELLSQRFTRDAAYKFEKAERDLSYPTVSLVGAAGFLPEIWNPNPATPIPNYYDAAAVNVEIPVFNGHLFAARRAAASLRAQAGDQKLRDLEDSIARDVRSAWADSTTAYQRLSVTDQLLQQANLALNLAQSRYQLGLSSIVELSQAQLNQTQAEIEQASAKYEYQSQAALLEYQIGALH